MQIEGMVVLITGAASGLGRATTERLTRLGAEVVAVDHDAASLERLATALPTVSTVCADITSTAQVAEAVAQACARGPVGALLNCAGGGLPPRRTVDRAGVPAELEPWRRVIDLNLVAAYDLTRQVAGAMARGAASAEARGVIIHVSSIAALDGSLGVSSYTAAKGALAPLVHTLARDLSPHGIRVMAIAPGVFDTPMFAALPDSVQERRATDYVFPPRPGAPSEFAHLVQHIIENDYLNGDCIRIDGAMRLHQ